MATRTAASPPPVGSSQAEKLTFAIEMLTKSIDRRDGEISTLRSDARSDFRLIFGASIATTLSLAGVMAKGFHWF